MGLTNRHRVFYDDACAFCVRQVGWLARLDWGNRFRWVPASSAEAGQLATRLAPGALLAAIHSVSREGAVCRGARCLRFIGLRIPLLVPVALCLWIPGMLALAEAAYRQVSRRRRRCTSAAARPVACACDSAAVETPSGSSGLPNPGRLP